jgi:hypothetical protein
MSSQRETTPEGRGRRFATLPAAGPAPPLIRVYQIAPAGIQYLTALAEASDGIGLVRTLDEDRGISECWIMPDFEAGFEQLLAAVAREWPMQPMGREFE